MPNTIDEEKVVLLEQRALASLTGCRWVNVGVIHYGGRIYKWEKQRLDQPLGKHGVIKSLSPLCSCCSHVLGSRDPIDRIKPEFSIASTRHVG
jgi:hypothetical protein